MPKDVATECAQRHVRDVLGGRRVRRERVDGAAAAARETRAALWAVPGAERAAYPQLFVRSAAGALTCVGGAAAFALLVERNDTDHGLDALCASLAPA